MDSEKKITFSGMVIASVLVSAAFILVPALRYLPLLMYITMYVTVWNACVLAMKVMVEKSSWRWYRWQHAKPIKIGT